MKIPSKILAGLPAPSVKNAQLAIEHIFPMVEEFKTAKPPSKIKVDQPQYGTRREVLGKRKRGVFDEDVSDEENVDSVSETPDSDESWD
ncbi:uncharacterized protein NPIL_19501 [Nephila pilipes]|uniref:Uncharacterized protein n=1 Tax=Nephila pilipes TaxID=299642 RepID=A0A8X6QKZ0_NEPPI|nr:uncharacterized protein NPIL_19501 [Nephila pilipes]